MIRQSTITAFLLLAGLGTCGGCVSSDGSGGTDLNLISREEAQTRYADPESREDLRARAIDGLGALASDPDPQVRANAIEAMLEAPERVEPIVRAGLKDANLGVRTVAAMAAGKLALVEVAPDVRPLLTDPSPFVRAAAIFALRRCGQDVDPTPLASMLLNDPSVRVRAHAAVILGELGDASALGLLRQAAKDPMVKADQAEVRLLRLQIAEAMVKLGDDEQVGPIRAALYPSQPDELEATALAVQIIGQVDDRAAVDQLIYLAQRKNERNQTMPAEIRLGVAGALAKMGKPEGTFVAEEFRTSENAALRAQAAFVYGQTGQVENLARLELLMIDPAPTVRVSAAGAVLVATDRIGGAPASRTASEGGSGG
jgi:HEAT repeat protein